MTKSKLDEKIMKLEEELEDKSRIAKKTYTELDRKTKGIIFLN